LKRYIVPDRGAVCISYQAGYYGGSSFQKFLTACITARLPNTTPDQAIEINLFVCPELVATLHLANILVVTQKGKPKTFTFNPAPSVAEAKRKAASQYSWWRGNNLSALCGAAENALLARGLITKDSDKQHFEIIDTDGDEMFRYKYPNVKNKDVYLRIKLHNVFTFFHKKKDELTAALARILAFAQRGHILLNQAIDEKNDLNNFLQGTSLSPELLKGFFEYFPWEQLNVINETAINILCELLGFDPATIKTKVQEQEKNDLLARNVFCDLFLSTYGNFKNNMLPYLNEIKAQGITKEQIGENFWSRMMFSCIDVLCYYCFDEDILYITPQETNPCIEYMVNIGKVLLNKTPNFPVKTSESNAVKEALSIASPLTDEEKKQIITSLFAQLDPSERGDLLDNLPSPNTSIGSSSSSSSSSPFLIIASGRSSTSPTSTRGVSPTKTPTSPKK
jgi:hypothetical protein